MADQMTSAGSDADSFDLAPDPPLNREKTRAAHANWVLELQKKPEFQLVQAFSQQSHITLEDVLHQLIDMTHEAALEEEIGNHCWVTACCFLELAALTAPEQQTRLVELLLSLRSVVLTDSSTDAPIAFEDGEGIIWQDLPTFGYTIADEMGSFGAWSSKLVYSNADVIKMVKNEITRKRKLRNGKT